MPKLGNVGLATILATVPNCLCHIRVPGTIHDATHTFDVEMLATDSLVQGKGSDAITS